MALNNINGRFRMDYYVQGKRVREFVSIKGVPTEKITKKMAEKCYAIRKAQIAEGKFDLISQDKAPLFEKFMNRYLEEYSKPNKRSWERDVTSMKNLNDFFKGRRLSNISSFDIERYKSKRRKDSTHWGKAVEPTTINIELSLLKHSLGKAVEWNLIRENPATKVKLFKKQKKAKRVLTDEEFEQLYNACNGYMKDVIVVAVNSGLRTGEVVNLEWEDINLVDKYLTVRESKNNEFRNVPLNQTLISTFKKLRVRGKNVFSKENGEKYGSFRDSFKRAVKRSSIRYCTFHCLRHTFCTNLAMNGIGLETIKKLAGHKDISTTLIYTNPSDSHLKNAVETLNIRPKDGHYLGTKGNIEESVKNFEAV